MTKKKFLDTVNFIRLYSIFWIPKLSFGCLFDSKLTDKKPPISAQSIKKGSGDSETDSH